MLGGHVQLGPSPNDARAARKSRTPAPASTPVAIEAPEPPFELENLLCLGCDRTPSADHIQWSSFHHRPVHTAILNAAPGAMPRLCGGFVVRREDAWEANLLPGSLALCLPSRVRSTAHHVRLGRPNGKRNQSWTGTPLCGAQPKARYWLPIQRNLERQFRTCGKCRKLLASQPS